jgi:hypothetical protein
MNPSRSRMPGDDRFQGTEEPASAAAAAPIVQDDVDVLILEVDEEDTPEAGLRPEPPAETASAEAAYGEAGSAEARSAEARSAEAGSAEAGPAAVDAPAVPVPASDEAAFVPVPAAGTAPATETVPDVAPVGVTPGMPLVSDSPAAHPDQRWHEIQSMFVDDPRGSVERAADLAAETLRGLITVLREREQSLKSSWQGADTDTEELRNSLRSYRDLVDRVDEFSRRP